MPTTRLNPQKQAIKSTVPFSIVSTDGLSEQVFIAPGVDGEVLKMIDGEPAWGTETGGLNTLTEDFTPPNTGSSITISNIPIAILSVSRNGIIQSAGVGKDYTMSGQVLTFSIPFSSSTIQITYLY